MKKKKGNGVAKLRTIVIAICGTHGSGKTTLMFVLAQILQKFGFNVKTISETSTEAGAYGFEINEGTDTDAQEWILHHLFDGLLHFLKSGRYHVIIADRHVDNAAYARLRFGKGGEPHVLMALAHLMNRTYDMFVFVPKSRPKFLIPNGTRAVGQKKTKTAIKFQSGAEREIFRLFRELAKKTKQFRRPFNFEILPETNDVEKRERAQLVCILKRICPVLKRRFPKMTPPHLEWK